MSLQFSEVLQRSLHRKSSTPLECAGPVRGDVGDGDNNIYYDHLSTMAWTGVGHRGGIVNIHFDLFAVAHIERRGSGVRIKKIMK